MRSQPRLPIACRAGGKTGASAKAERPRHPPRSATIDRMAIEPAGMKKPRRWLTRRRFLATGLAGACGAGLYTWRVEPHWVEVVERDLPIAGLPSDLHGRRLVQLSDLHVGRSVDSDYLIACLQRVATLEPDLTVITGDFMTCYDTEQVDHV